MAVTIKEMAEQLNLSPATISLALNDKPGVNAQTRVRVLAFAQSKGYLSRTTGEQKSLSGNGNIRLVVYKKLGRVVADTPFFLALTEGIEAETRRKGYQLLISHISDFTSYEQVMKIIRDNLNDGLILLATELLPADLAPFFEMGHALVILDGSLSDAQCDTVLINNFQGAYDAVTELVNKGHRRIGYIKSAVPIYNFKQRQAGVLGALADSLLELDPECICEVEPSIEGSNRGVSEWLAEKPKLPTAFFADNDIIAFGAMKAIRDSGLDIPGDISLIGFDDLPYCTIIEPTLTTIKVFIHSLGKIAVCRLIERMQNKIAEVVRIEVATELVERKSVKLIM